MIFMNSVLSLWLPLGGPYWGPGTCHWGPGTCHWELATGNPELATGNPELATGSGAATAARTLPSTRAGGQDDVSFTNSLK